jgi:predicted TPR repeat methyltransferase
MSDSWDDYADEWDTNDDVKLYAERAFKTLTDITSLERVRVLDFGCGTGLLTEKLSSLASHIVALDSSPKMISVLENKKLPNVTSVTGLLSESLIVKNESFHKKFDLIVASSVCSFLPEYESIFPLLKSILVQGGIFIQWDWLSPEKSSDFGLSKERVNAAFESSGFTTISITTPFSLTSSKGTMSVVMGVAKKV